MFRPRIIPTLLLQNLGLVKTIKFNNHRYIGDPINAVKIFNDSGADELVFLDISASKLNRSISLDFVKKVGEEANMPFSVGGGIKDIETIKKILAAGAEKVVIGSEAFLNPNFIRQATNTFGSSTIISCIDIKQNIFGKHTVRILNGKKNTGIPPITYAKNIEESGIGEIIIQSIDRDGTMQGYDVELIKKVSNSVKVPIIALGGAASLDDLDVAWSEGYANALAAGSLFVYKGKRRGILINYPSKDEINKLFNQYDQRK